MSPFLAALLGAAVTAVVWLAVERFRPPGRGAKPGWALSGDRAGGPPDIASQLIESSTDGIVAYDADLRYILWNPAMERISGLAAERVLGRRAPEVFPFLETIGEIAYLEQALAGRTVTSDERRYVVPETGREGYFQGRYAPIRDATGSVIGGLAIVRDETGSRIVEEVLAQETASLHALFEGAPDAVALVDPSGTVLRINREFTRLFGYAADEVQGRSLDQLLAPEPDRPAAVALTGQAAEERVTREGTRRAKDGRLVDVLIAGAPIRLPDGLHGVYAVYHDISERKWSERTVSALLRVAELLNSTRDVEQLLALLVEEAIALANAESGCAGLREGEALRSTRYLRSGRWEDVEYRWRPGEGLPGWLLEHGRSYVTNDAAHDPQIVAGVREAHDVRHAVSTPVMAPGREVIAFFEVHNSRTPGGFSDRDRTVLSAVADQAAIAVQNAFAYQRLARAEQARAREAQHARLLEAVAVAANQAAGVDEAIRQCLEIVVRDLGWSAGHAFRVHQPAGRLEPTGIWAGEMGPEWVGFRRQTDELLLAAGAGLPGRVVERGMPEWLTALDRPAEFVRAAGAGRAGIRSAVAIPMFAGDDVVAVLEFFDQAKRAPDADFLALAPALGTILGRVFEREHSRAALRHARDRFATFFQSSPMPTAIVSLEDGRFREVNRRFLEFVGRSADDVVGRTAVELGVWVTPGDRAAVTQRLRETGHLEEYEARVQAATGVRDVVVTMQLIDLDGRPHVLGSLLDVTRRRRLERATRILIEGMSRETGETFLRTLVHKLVDVLAVDYAFVGRMVGDGTVRTVAVSFRGGLLDDFAYPIAGTPCEHVVGRDMCAFPARVAERFPDDAMLRDLGIEAYIGAPLFDAQARPLGLLVLMHRRPIEDVELMRSVLGLFALRAGTELERERAEQDLNARMRQQHAVAELAQLALRETQPGALFRRAVRTVADILHVELSAVLEYDAAQAGFTIRANHGWPDVAAESVVIPDGRESQAGYTLEVGEVVHVQDLETETRFRTDLFTEHGVRGGISAVIPGPVGPFGVLAVHSRSAREFPEDDRTVVRAIANVLGLAVQRARVEERLRDRQEELRSLSHRLIEAQEMERRRIARELHDELGQVLSAVKLNLEAVDQMAKGRQLQSPLRDAIQVVEEAIRQTRDLAYAIRPSMLDDLGLAAAISSYAREQAGRADVRLTLQVDPPPEPPAAAVELACFRIVQEAVLNALRHAEAERLTIRLHADAEGLELLVEDDGRGFNAEAAMGAPATAATIGVLGMRERAELVGGRLDIRSVPGAGTTVHVWLPVNGDGAVPS